MIGLGGANLQLQNERRDELTGKKNGSGFWKFSGMVMLLNHMSAGSVGAQDTIMRGDAMSKRVMFGQKESRSWNAINSLSC